MRKSKVLVPDKLFDGDFHKKMEQVGFVPRETFTIEHIQKLRTIEKYN